MVNSWVIFCWFLFVMVGFSASGEVVLTGKNFTLMFPDIEANFASPVKGSGKCGVLYVADPLDACSPLMNKIAVESKSPFVLIIRGKCSFEDKVRTAEKAGFEAAIVYNNEDGDLISMAGNSEGINIHALFVSKNAGDTLLQYSAATAVDIDLWIIPSTGTPDWSILTISFVSVIAMSVVLATCFFVRRHQIRRNRLFQAPNVREFHGLSSHLVKAMPSLIFTAVSEDNSTSSTCAICLEDYTMGERLRVLPCDHKFHAICVDTWLTSWRTFCPICKHDLRNAGIEKPASESTPLLVSRPSSSSLILPLSAPGGMHIRVSSSSHSSSVWNNPSVSSSYHINSLRSYSSPHLTRSRASRFDNSFLPLALPNNMGSSPTNAASLLQYSESESPPNPSPIASAQSLPDC